MRGMVLAAVLALWASPAAAQAGMTMFDAAERLQAERGSAVACARIAKRLLPADDKRALSRMELAYEEARTEVMAGIAGLRAALIDKQEEAALPGISRRLERGGALRETFCAEVKAMMLEPAKGQKNVAVLGPVVELAGKLVDAGLAIWQSIREDDKERRDNLRSLLESMAWPAFADIPANG